MTETQECVLLKDLEMIQNAYLNSFPNSDRSHIEQIINLIQQHGPVNVSLLEQWRTSSQELSVLCSLVKRSYQGRLYKSENPFQQYLRISSQEVTFFVSLFGPQRRDEDFTDWAYFMSDVVAIHLKDKKYLLKGVKELRIDLQFPFFESPCKFEKVFKTVTSMKYILASSLQGYYHLSAEDIPETFVEDMRNKFKGCPSEALKNIERYLTEPLEAINFPLPGTVTHMPSKDDTEQWKRSPSTFFENSVWMYKSSNEYLDMKVQWKVNEFKFSDVIYRGIHLASEGSLNFNWELMGTEMRMVDNIYAHMNAIYNKNDECTTCDRMDISQCTDISMESAKQEDIEISSEDFEQSEWILERRHYSENAYLFHTFTPAGQDFRYRFERETLHLSVLSSWSLNSHTEHFKELTTIVRRNCLARHCPLAPRLQNTILFSPQNEITFHISPTMEDDFMTDIYRMNIRNETISIEPTRDSHLQLSFRSAFPWFQNEQDLKVHLDYITRVDMFAARYFERQYFPYSLEKMKAFPSHLEQWQSRLKWDHQNQLREYFEKKDVVLFAFNGTVRCLTRVPSFQKVIHIENPQQYLVESIWEFENENNEFRVKMGYRLQQRGELSLYIQEIWYKGYMLMHHTENMNRTRKSIVQEARSKGLSIHDIFMTKSLGFNELQSTASEWIREGQQLLNQLTSIQGSVNRKRKRGQYDSFSSPLPFFMTHAS